MPKYATEIESKLAKIKNAEKIRDDSDKKFGYSRCLAEYNGNFKDNIPSFMTGIDLIPINEVYAFVKTFIPSVYSRDPFIAVNPKGTKYVIGAKILEMAINAYWRELKLKKQIRKAIFDSLFAEGWIKVGYSASLGDSSKPKDGMSLNPSEFIEDEEIFAQRISWKNIVRDPDAIDGIHDARFVAHQLILPIEAVRESSLYEHTSDLKPNYSLERTYQPGQGRGPVYKSTEEFVVLYELWDRDSETVCTICEGHDKYLMEKKWPYKFRGYPFEMLRFNESTDEPYAPNMIAPWEPQLWEKIKIRAMELDHIKRFGRQMIAEKGALSRIEMDKFKKGITGTVIQKELGKPDPVPVAYPPIQTDIYGIENRIDLDKDNISGQPNVIRAAPQKTSSRTLGEVDRLISAFMSRQNDPQSVVEEFAESISTKLAQLMQQYFKQDKYIRASNIDAAWIQRELKDTPSASRFEPTGFLMKPEDIKDIEFEIEVRAGSALPLDRKNRISAMTSVIELGDKIGITPGDKVSKIIGKNLITEFDMPEIIAAYEDELNKLKAQEITQHAAGLAHAELMKRKLGDLRNRMRSAASSNGASAPPPPSIPPELLS